MPEPSCDFPLCTDPVEDPGTSMCTLHRNVHVSTSWPDDRHADGGHG